MKLLNLLKNIFVLLSLCRELNCQTTQNINVLFINEVGNEIAQKALEVAINYVKKTPSLSLSIEATMVEGNRTDGKKFLSSLCQTYGEMVKSGKAPHLIIDATKTGNASHVVKSFSDDLGIPTISTSFFNPKEWNNLTEKRKQYLLQVLPPTDILTEIIKPLANYMNMTDLATLYDKNFIVDHKMLHFTRTIANWKIANDKKAATEQISLLKEKGFQNFLILGRLESIKMFLESAPKECFNASFAWHVITEEKGELYANVENATIMFIRPAPDERSKDRLGTMKTTFNLKMEPEIESAFYFDVMLKAFLAIRSILQQGKWPPNMKYQLCDHDDGTNGTDHSIDLASAFREVSEPPTYSTFELGGKNDVPFNGFSFMNFTVDIMRVIIRSGASVNNLRLGTWTAGLNNELKIESVEEMNKMTAMVRERLTNGANG